MKVFLRSKLFSTFVALVMSSAAIIVPLTGSITRAQAQGNVTITEFPIPNSNGDSAPFDITSGPDGNLWFVEFNTNRIVKITPSGTFTEYTNPTISSPSSITSGPDGNLWFTELYGSKIGKITPNGTITEYATPIYGVSPWDITSGPDGNLWFVERGVNQIGKITPSGTITEYPIPTSNSIPWGITSGPDGNIWFTEESVSKIGKITPSGAITEYATPTSNSAPYYITSGPDGNIWFTEDSNEANKIGKITPNGTITEFPVPTADSYPTGITSGPDGNLWFTEEWTAASKIGKITPSGKITEYATPSFGSHPFGITSGSDGNIWFTEYQANRIGRVNLSKQSQFTSYNPGNYAGKSGNVSVGSYNEPNDFAHRNYCGPGASQVLISAWTSNVPDIETLATDEKTNRNGITFMKNMVDPINNAIGQSYYSLHHAQSQADFSNMIGRDILDNHHPLITGIVTIYKNNQLNGWTVPATHIITIYGFDFSSPTVGYIYYYETAGTVSGTTATGPNRIDYNVFWSLVQQNNIQLS